MTYNVLTRTLNPTQSLTLQPGGQSLALVLTTKYRTTKRQ